MKNFDITLRPYWGDDTVTQMDIEMSVPAGFEQENQSVLHYPNQAFGGRVPFPDYTNLILYDELGEIPYYVDDTPTINYHMTYKGIYVKRNLAGMLSWKYRIFPRILPEKYSSSPYYDFRNEPFGLNGSGYFAFILPNCEEELNVTLNWDLSWMPQDARAIWSYGEGDVSRKLKAQEVAHTMFQVGVMNAVENDSFGVYWFGNPDFDIASVARKIMPIFDYMKDFFKNSEANFKVFLRRDPFKNSGGGSACPYAFISGYSAWGKVDLDQWFNVLVHEMVHTWIHMEGGDNENVTWFNEGATEYYCTMIPFWGGFLDAEYIASVINDKVNPYYHNIYRDTDNQEIVKIQWQDLRAQVIPYGRGFLYLASVEAKLRKANKGSINDIIVSSTDMPVLTVERWKIFIKEKLGDSGLADFEDMKAGKLIIPESNLFGEEFEMIEKQIELDGRKTVAYQWKVKCK